jgi:signal transduction histidine kinase
MLGGHSGPYRVVVPRDRLADALLFVLAVAFTVLTVIDNAGRQMSAAAVVADATLGALACLGVWWRRRQPVGFAIATAALSVFSIAASGVALIALFTVAVHRRLAVTAAMVAVFGGASLLAPVVRPDLPAPNLSQGALGLIVVAALIGWGLYLRARRQLLLSLQEQARQVERQRIAREMHDVLAHRLSLLSLHAGALEVNPGAPAEQIARAARVIRDSAHAALDDLRDVIGVLRSPSGGDASIPDRPQPTATDLPGLIEESRLAGMEVGFDCRLIDLATVPDALGRNVYRIVQEGLTNARKHASGAKVSVVVDGAPGDGVTVELRNPMTALATDVPGAGTGLTGLAERVAIAGGRLEHGRAHDHDFRLWAWLPWPG